MNAKRWMIRCAGALAGLILAACGASGPAVQATPTNTPAAPVSQATLPLGEATIPSVESGSGPTVAPTPDWNSVLPMYQLVVGDQTIDGIRGGFCWPIAPEGSEAARVYCTDIMLPPIQTYTPLPAGEPIKIRLSGEPLPETVTISLQVGEIQAVVDQIYIESPQNPDIAWTYNDKPGRYTLVVYAKWASQGSDLAYYYGVEVPAGSSGTATPTP